VCYAGHWYCFFFFWRCGLKIPKLHAMLSVGIRPRLDAAHINNTTYLRGTGPLASLYALLEVLRLREPRPRMSDLLQNVAPWPSDSCSLMLTFKCGLRVLLSADSITWPVSESLIVSDAFVRHRMSQKVRRHPAMPSWVSTCRLALTDQLVLQNEIAEPHCQIFPF
jgi:hypothetical protein